MSTSSNQQPAVPASKNYEKMAIYAALIGGGLLLAYKAFSAIGDIGGGGPGGGGVGTKCPVAPAAPGLTVVINPPQSTFGDVIASWFASTGWGLLLAANPTFPSMSDGTGGDTKEWAFTYDGPGYTRSGYIFTPNCFVALWAGFPSTFTMQGNPPIINSNVAFGAPTGTLLGLASGSGSNSNYGKQYSMTPPNPNGSVPPPNRTGNLGISTLNFSPTFTVFYQIAVASWNIAPSATCPPWVLNSGSGTNVKWGN